VLQLTVGAPSPGPANIAANRTRSPSTGVCTWRQYRSTAPLASVTSQTRSAVHSRHAPAAGLRVSNANRPSSVSADRTAASTARSSSSVMNTWNA
jgi:hypothetical protein